MARRPAARTMPATAQSDAVNARYEGDTLVYLEQKKEGSNAA